jgi:hypothetical protein
MSMPSSAQATADCTVDICDFQANGGLYLNAVLLSGNTWSGPFTDMSGVTHSLYVYQFKTNGMEVSVDGKYVMTSGYSTWYGPSKPPTNLGPYKEYDEGSDLLFYYIPEVNPCSNSVAGKAKPLPNLVPCT